ncbi:MAG: T9SS type A sorting domain-containing protein [Saprospiraceae bacterium]
MSKIIRYVLWGILFCTFIPFGFSQWQFLGCPDIGVPVDFDATGDTIFVSTIAGGFFSDDQGMSWTPVNMPDSAIFPLEIRVENKHLYLMASTEDMNYSKTSIYRSDDMGATWKDITSFLKFHTYFSDYVIQEDTLSIFAGDSVFISHDNGNSYQGEPTVLNSKPFLHQNVMMIVLGNTLYQSHDQGITWDSVYASPDSVYLQDISSIDNDLWKTDWIHGYNDHEISRSSDNGLSWVIVFTIADSTFKFYSPVVLGQGGNIFLTDQSASDKLYFSGDNGLNWEEKDIPENSFDAFFTNDLLLFRNFKGIYVSSDHGDSFGLANSGFKAASVNGITWNGQDLFVNANYSMFKKSVAGQWNELLNAYGIVSTTDGHMLGFVDGAPKRSNNGGNTWTAIPPEAFGWPFYYSFRRFICADDMMYAESPIESWYSSDFGVTWKSVVGFVDLIEYHQKYIASTMFGGVMISDNGIDWQDITYDFDPPFNDITAIQYHQGFVFVSVPDGLYRLSPSATTWEHLTGPVPVSPVFNYPVLINTIKSHDNILIAGTHGYGVYISNDNGDSWTEANQGLDDRQVLSSNITEDEIYIGVQGGVWKRALSELTLSGTSDPKRKLSLSISPNPVNDFLNITINDDDIANEIHLSLYDAKGTLVKSLFENNQNNIQMDIRKIPSGIYFLQAISGVHQGMIKLIKN